MPFTIILLAAIVIMAVGMLWYSPFLFLNQWLRLSGLNAADMEAMKAQGMGKTYFGAFMNAIIISFSTFLLLRLTNAHTWEKAYPVGFLVWLGFVATVGFSGVLWERKPLKLYLLHTGQYLIAIFAAISVFLVSKVA